MSSQVLFTELTVCPYNKDDRSDVRLAFKCAFGAKGGNDLCGEVNPLIGLYHGLCKEA